MSKSANEWILEERLVAYLDPGSEWILLRLNEPPGIETTSSCLGRIALIEGEWPWERRATSRIVYKTHTVIAPERLALEAAKHYRDLWLKVTGPIFPARISTLECARWLLERARAAGFKHSGIISPVTDKGCCVVEVSAPTGFAAPIRLSRVFLVTREGLLTLASKANHALAEGRRRLALLALSVSSSWRESPCASPPHS